MEFVLDLGISNVARATLQQAASQHKRDGVTPYRALSLMFQFQNNGIIRLD